MTLADCLNAIPRFYEPLPHSRRLRDRFYWLAKPILEHGGVLFARSGGRTMPIRTVFLDERGPRATICLQPFSDQCDAFTLYELDDWQFLIQCKWQGNATSFVRHYYWCPERSMFGNAQELKDARFRMPRSHHELYCFANRAEKAFRPGRRAWAGTHWRWEGDTWHVDRAELDLDNNAIWLSSINAIGIERQDRVDPEWFLVPAGLYPSMAVVHTKWSVKRFGVTTTINGRADLGAVLESVLQEGETCR